MSVKILKETLLEKIGVAAQKAYNQKPEGLEIGFTPNPDLGHFGVACFPLAKQFRKSPAEIAEKLADNMAPDDVLQKAVATGPYLNLTVSTAVLFGDLCSEISSEDNSYGGSSAGSDKRVMVEYLSPNTYKPLHLGHLRNGALGMSVARLYEATGHWVVKANLINDRGVHICKSMLAYQKWGEHKTPESESIKGDHFVGTYYVLFNKKVQENPELEKEFYNVGNRMWFKKVDETSDFGGLERTPVKLTK